MRSPGRGRNAIACVVSGDKSPPSDQARKHQKERSPKTDKNWIVLCPGCGCWSWGVGGIGGEAIACI
ncbi:hypothetical protein [Nostoc sp.]|uniref:hypothetical protein n=1 Tax=Nostoc sp. TaxID=1180 RepID=UPI002FF7AB52